MFKCKRMEQKYSKKEISNGKNILRCAGFVSLKNTSVAKNLNWHSLRFVFSFIIDFIFISNDILSMCMCVNMFLRICSMTACVTLKF